MLGGEIAAAWNILGPIIHERLKSQYIIPEVARIEIRPASVQRPSLFGAIPIALQNCFQTPLQLNKNPYKSRAKI